MVSKKNPVDPQKHTQKGTRSRKKNITLSEEVKILHRIIETISYNLDLDEILKEIIAVVDSVAHADEIFVYLLQKNRLVLRASKNTVSDEMSRISLKVGQGITGWAAEKRQTVQLNRKAYADKRFFPFPNLQADTFEAILSLPLIHHEKLIGVFNVQHRDAHNMTKREVRMMEIIAHATAGAFENARLFEQTAVLSEALEARKAIEQAKGRLMKQYQLSEDEAYQWLKKRAMDLRKTMKEIAEAVMISIE